VTPVYWFHYTPDALIVLRRADQTFADFVARGEDRTGQAVAGRVRAELGQSRRARAAQCGVRRQDDLRPVQGHGRHDHFGARPAVDGAMTYTAFAVNNKGRVRALAVAMEKRHPLLPDVPTFRELGVDWVDGAYRGIGVPKSTPPDLRKRMADLWAALNNDPEMKDSAAKNGFELVNIGNDQMDAFMVETNQAVHRGGATPGLGKKQP
jgi:hypothetical protein